MSLMTGMWIALCVGGAAGLTLVLVLMATFLSPTLGFWPARDAVRKVVVLSLFRIYCAALLAVAALSIWQAGLGGWPRYLLGIPIMIGAYWASVRAYATLGRKNTYFGTEGLVTEGPYALSRNPGYVASLIESSGLTIAAGTWAALAMAMGLLAIYWLFAVNEERWLIRGYGRAFLHYMKRTPRFLDARSLGRARAALLGN
ncbi:CzcN domain protein [Roseibacterium elongatum DSM 19469]|uniref:CzcN domain protein n=1 Tax=Roseicyclus elongatus DSM 19469 TaxID=1294273 RepID=W8RSY1_9RHOB|nr:PEMT/PEM2 methyltransferase family protein [Roseibacterium elongatum]AHM04319.1 CzcN domain protein [Roseibacterium elongatum DSM 19469]